MEHSIVPALLHRYPPMLPRRKTKISLQQVIHTKQVHNNCPNLQQRSLKAIVAYPRHYVACTKSPIRWSPVPRAILHPNAAASHIAHSQGGWCDVPTPCTVIPRHSGTHIRRPASARTPLKSHWHLNSPRRTCRHSRGRSIMLLLLLSLWGRAGRSPAAPKPLLNPLLCRHVTTSSTSTCSTLIGEKLRAGTRIARVPSEAGSVV
jgi:hypothetical protein